MNLKQGDEVRIDWTKLEKAEHSSLWRYEGAAYFMDSDFHYLDEHDKFRIVHQGGRLVMMIGSQHREFHTGFILPIKYQSQAEIDAAVEQLINS